MIFILRINARYCYVIRQDGGYNWCPMLNRENEECEAHNTPLIFDVDEGWYVRCKLCKKRKTKRAANAKT